MEDCELKMPFIYMCKSQTVNFTTPQFYHFFFSLGFLLNLRRTVRIS